MLSYAQFGGDFMIWWTYLNEDSFSRASNVCSYVVLGKPLQPTEAKGSYFMYFPWLLEQAALSLFNITFFFVKEQLFETGLMTTKETAIDAES